MMNLEARRRCLFRLLAATGGSLAGIGVAAVSCRWWLGLDPTTLAGAIWARLGSRTRPEIDDPGELQLWHSRLVGKYRWPFGAQRASPALGYYEYTPRVRGPVMNVAMGSVDFRHHVHRTGYRIGWDADPEAVRPGGVMFVGCSFTYGDGVDAEQTFAHAATDSLQTEAYNFGACGYSYPVMLLQLEELLRRNLFARLAPRACVLGAGGWLVDRSLQPFFPASFFQLKYPWLARGAEGVEIRFPPEGEQYSAFAAFLDAYYRDGREGSLTAEREVLLRDFLALIARLNEEKSAFSPDPISPDEVCWLVLDRFQRLCQKAGTRPVVFWLPSPNFPDGGHPLASAMRRACAQRDLALVDGTRIWQRGIDRLGAFPHRDHPSAGTHRALGELLAADLARLDQPA